MGVRTWLDVVAGLPAADGRRPAGPGSGGAVAALARPRAPHGHRGPGGPVRLPVLRGRLRASGSTCTDEKVVQIEGNPDSPISRGRLCPKGSASLGLVTGPQRETKVRYRAPYATEWTELDLHEAMEMVADRVLDARERGWQEHDPNGARLRRTHGPGEPGRRGA